MKKLFQKKEENVITEEVGKEETLREEIKADEGETPEEKRKIPWKKIGIAGGSTLAVLLVIFIGFSVYFSSHFYFRSTVNGVSASGASASSVLKRMEDAVSGYQLTLVEAGGKKEVLTTRDLGMVINIQEKEIEKLLDSQNGFLWVHYLIHGKDYQDDKLVSCDLKTIEARVAELDCVKDENPIKTQNANVKYQGGEFEIVDAVYGTELDAKQFAKDIEKAALTLKKELNLKEDACYIQPKYTADSKEVKQLQKELNKYLDTRITYTVGNEKEEIPKDTIGSWLSGDDKMKPAFDQEAMTDFVSSMGRKYDTYGQPKTLATQYGVTVTVPGGNYGWRISREDEVAQLQKDIASGEKIERDFKYQYEAASRDGNDYGNSYVEINRTAQHLYLIMNGSVVVDTPMVSGKNDGEHDTPTGAYRITYCERNATLRGPGYATPVAYWMPFNGDIGLHDATWQKAFGGSRYKEGYGSHGCVNLPLSAAGQIFANVSTGFPVLMYDLPGTETVDSLTKQAAEDCKNIINSIGAVTLNSGATIGAARGAYDALTESGKACVDNYQVLTNAEAAYAQLVDQVNKQAAEEQKARDKEMAKSVTKMIADLPQPLTPDSSGAVQEAQKAYDALSDQGKSFVTNYDVLKAARKELGL